LFDAVWAIWSHTSRDLQPLFLKRLAAVQLIFMQANQLPLLDIASTPSSPLTAVRASLPTTMQRFAGLLSKSRRFRGPSAKLRVIAFTDPNDLLSYRLTPAHIGHPDINVTNVIVSNDWTYFGVLERPDTAHCGYAWNSAVLGAIVNGYDGQFPSRSTVDVPHDCGL